MKNMATKLIGDVLIAVHTSSPPNEEEWQAYLKLVHHAGSTKGGDMSRIRSLVVTDGGGPNAAQRKELTEVLQKLRGWKDSPGAVVSASPVVRGIVTVLNWFNMSIKTFSPDRMEDAFQWLHISEDEAPRIMLEIRAMRSSLGPR